MLRSRILSVMKGRVYLSTFDLDMVVRVSGCEVVGFAWWGLTTGDEGHMCLCLCLCLG